MLFIPRAMGGSVISIGFERWSQHVVMAAFPDIQHPRQTTARRISRPVCVLAARLGERRFPTASSAPFGACDVGSSTGRLYNGYQFY